MISTKTHEIVFIPRFLDPVKAFDEIIVKNNMDYLEVSDAQLKYVQLTGVDWRDKFNWAWLISCGYLPYSEATRRRALPTIDRGNHHQYVFDSTIYCCADTKKSDIIFDVNVHGSVCPNCGIIHWENFLIRPDHLWEDFPVWPTIEQFSKDPLKYLDRGKNYKYSRLLKAE